MAVGLMLPTYLDREERLTLAESADDLGVDAVFTGESASSNLFIDLTWIASRTSTVTIGAGIANVFSRSPSLIALSAAELDGISDGRVILGLGSSTPPLIEGLHGVPFERPVSRTAEYIDIIRAGWTGDRLEYDGDFYSPSGGKLLETPIQDDIPIAVAALGPANRRLTGAKGDVWLPHLVPKSVLGELAADVYDAARDRGRAADGIDVDAYVPTAIDEDADAAYDRVRRHVATYAGSAEPYRDAIADAGYGSIMDVHRAWQDGDRDGAAELVTDELVEDIGLVGTPSDAPAALSRWRDAGADMVVMNFAPGTSVDDIRTALAAVS
ncbi:LLM class flavin-dependent oxidoreductase [Natrinema caseinilyticum]|uniref:LLM class flavin-dependent oxidoreductase n=1 Tax=Natrinema caseinilyticum TaxID=2961570 RepID=UPI0020C3AB94|nr:LLM class flavin-dependent oxidoreductase [Natrinema caseinilyticum]